MVIPPKRYSGELLWVSVCRRERNVVYLPIYLSPTEVTIGCTSRRVGPDDRKENIGRPFPSCSAHVVDRNLDIVPMGCPGELVISGPLVARGTRRHKLGSSGMLNLFRRIP